MRRARHQPHGGLQHGDASPFRAHQSPRHVEAVLGQQMGKVVARDAAGDVRIALPDQRRIAVAQLAQPAVDLASPAAGADDAPQLLLARGADPQPQALIGEDLQLLDVVVRLAGHHRVHAAGVVADHAAESAVVVGGRIGTEGQTVRLGRVAQDVEHETGLDARAPCLRVQLHDAIQILREIQHHRHVAALAGEAGAASPRQHGRAVAPADRERLDDVLDGARDHDADRQMPVVRGVGGVEGAAAGVEAHLARDGAAQIGGEGFGAGRERARVADCLVVRHRRRSCARPHPARRFRTGLAKRRFSEANRPLGDVSIARCGSAGRGEASTRKPL